MSVGVEGLGRGIGGSQVGVGGGRRGMMLCLGGKALSRTPGSWSACAVGSRWEFGGMLVEGWWSVGWGWWGVGEKLE